MPFMCTEFLTRYLQIHNLTCLSTCAHVCVIHKPDILCMGLDDIKKIAFYCGGLIASMHKCVLKVSLLFLNCIIQVHHTKKMRSAK